MGEYLSVAAGDGGVPLDDPGEEIALHAHAERERSDIEQDERVDLSAEHTTLDGRTHGYVDETVREWPQWLAQRMQGIG